MALKLACVSLHLAALAHAQTFNLLHSYKGLDFFKRGFTLYEGFDPTFGFVDYVSLTIAEQSNLLNLTEIGNTGVARWGVDTTGILDPAANLGRKSIRLQSVQTYTHGLFVLDVKHLPANVCGTWPAFWLVGTGVWPMTGEMDVIEQTNNQPANIMSLHSSAEPNCSIAGSGQMGTLLTNDCAVSPHHGGEPGVTSQEGTQARQLTTATQHANSYTGCAVSSPHLSGAVLNAAGGGAFVMLWTSQGMQMWTFERSKIPPSISNKRATPLLREFGAPIANFQGSCDFDAHFFDHQMIFNTDFCGSNAGETFEMHGCPMAEGKKSWESCNIYVANHPEAFRESYWEVNYLDVYEVVGAVVTLPSVRHGENSKQ